MNEDAGFLEDIIAHPEDDTPRLVFADWLDDRGKPGDADRAEFIRKQVELARLPEGNLRRTALETRAEELLNQHRQEWMQPLCGILPDLGDGDVFFARGFPSIVFLCDADSLAPAAQLAKVAPLQELHLDLADNLIDQERMQALANSKHLQHLTHLRIGNNFIGDDGVRTLAESPHLRRLTRLDLSYNQVGVAGARALAASPHLQRLTHLDLGFNEIGNEGTRALAESPHLQRLKLLDLSANRVGDEGARALAESPHLQHLTHLDLYNNNIENEDARALVASPHLQHLTTLYLGANNLGQAVLSEIKREMARRRDQAKGQGR